jgi:hypothetical protein
MLSALFPVMHAFHAVFSLRMGLSTEVSIIPYRQGNSEEVNAVVWEGDRPGWKANPMALNGNLYASNYGGQHTSR